MSSFPNARPAVGAGWRWSLALPIAVLCGSGCTGGAGAIAPTFPAATAEGGVYYHVRGTDTIFIERYERTRDSLIVWISGAGQAPASLVVRYASDGTLRSATYASAGRLTGAAQREWAAILTVGGDDTTTVVQIADGDTVLVRRLATRPGTHVYVYPSAALLGDMIRSGRVGRIDALRGVAYWISLPHVPMNGIYLRASLDRAKLDFGPLRLHVIQAGNGDPLVVTDSVTLLRSVAPGFGAESPLPRS